MDEVICKEVIITTLTRRGNGSDTPIRVITEIWDKDGTKIAEVDSLKPDLGVSKKDLQKAMIGSLFLETKDEFDSWYGRNFEQ